jgi:hypothetical protein
MALNFATLMADFNGTAMAIAGAAEWGFIPDGWKIYIPHGFNLPQNVQIGTDQLGNNAEIFLKANYLGLTTAGLAANEAFFVSCFRMYLAQQGILTANLIQRGVVEDEYVIIAPVQNAWNNAGNDIPVNVYNPNVPKYIKRYGKILIHHLAYVFLSRGHHYKQEYNELYERLKSACFIPSNPGFVIPSNETLYRLAVHGFGVKPLIDLTLADKAASRMAAAMEIRFSPHAPISGVAHMTTLKAALNQMAKEQWWPAFAQKFAISINDLDAEVALIAANPLTYHISARVLGANARAMPSNAGNDAFTKLCQYALGYIDHLGRKHSLSGQQAITKKSNGMTGLADAFSKACDKFGKPTTDVDTMAQFLLNI